MFLLCFFFKDTRKLPAWVFKQKFNLGPKYSWKTNEFYIKNNVPVLFFNIISLFPLKESRRKKINKNAISRLAFGTMCRRIHRKIIKKVVQTATI